MNRIYEPHQSSIFHLDANLLCVILYLIPLIGGLLSNTLKTLGWILPLIVFIVEKDSPFVKFHAAQCLIIQIVVAVISAVLSFFAILSAGASLLIGFNLFSFFGTLGITGIVLGLISLFVIVVEIVGAIKSWQWISYRLPVFGEITNLFVKE